jgi:hypothetical protein
MKKAKVDCSVHRFAKDGVRISIHVKAPGYGRFQTELRCDLDNREAADKVMALAQRAEKELDERVVETEEDAKAYVAKCGELLSELIQLV